MYFLKTEPRAQSQAPSVLPGSFLQSDGFRPTGNTLALRNREEPRISVELAPDASCFSLGEHTFLLVAPNTHRSPGPLLFSIY